jgi:superfamily II DNA helicase RecQ
VEDSDVSATQVTQAQRIIADAKNANEAEQNRAIEEAIQLLYPYPPHQGQRDTLRQLIYKRKDLILIAKTSFGKSMILQAVSILMSKSITVVVLPLDQIGQEQTAYIARIGGRPCILNAETFSQGMLADIQAGKYTHILLSPELAVGDKFHNTATYPGLKERLALVVVDEAHLVSQWGKDFRKEYARVGQLRSLFGNSVPWFACSATLDTETLEKVKKGIGFDEDVTIMRTSIDRPELAIRLGWIPNRTRKTATALRFLFDQGPGTDSESICMQQKIPKTVVFFDTKKEAYAAMHECRKWLQKKHQYSEKQAKAVIKVFHRDIAKYDKEVYIAEFQKLGENSSVRVIFATEALGMGVNLPDVRRVVQYGLPKGQEPAIMWQRGGRAGRDALDGEIILLVDEWVKGPRVDTPPSGKDGQSSQDLDEDESIADQTKARNLTLPERRSKLPDFWYTLTNDSGCCLRARFLDHFDEPPEYRNCIRIDRCCSYCNPELDLGVLDKYYLYNERGNSLNARAKRILELLTDWGEGQLAEVFPNPLFQPTVYCFLSEDQLEQLAKDAREILNLDWLRNSLGSWRFFPTHGEKLFKQLRTAYYATEGISKCPKKAKEQPPKKAKDQPPKKVKGKPPKKATAQQPKGESRKEATHQSPKKVGSRTQVSSQPDRDVNTLSSLGSLNKTTVLSQSATQPTSPTPPQCLAYKPALARPNAPTLTDSNRWESRLSTPGGVSVGNESQNI